MYLLLTRICTESGTLHVKGQMKVVRDPAFHLQHLPLGVINSDFTSLTSGQLPLMQNITYFKQNHCSSDFSLIPLMITSYTPGSSHL